MLLLLPKITLTTFVVCPKLKFKTKCKNTSQNLFIHLPPPPMHSLLLRLWRVTNWKHQARLCGGKKKGLQDRNK